MYQGTYTLIGQEMSMFTRKLEAQLRYQNIPYQWEIKSQQNTDGINTRAGTHFIPVLKTPDGWMINDTISIGPLLNDRFSDCPVVPDSPNAEMQLLYFGRFLQSLVPTARPALSMVLFR